MFCLLPGLTEMTGNLCNLTWILFCWLALVGLKDPSVPLTWIEVGLSVLVTLSIGTAILLVPLFLWRLVVIEGQDLHESLGPRHCSTGLLWLFWE